MGLRHRAYLREADIADLPLASVTEEGVRFETGKPVTFKYYRFRQNTGNFGSRFGQDIEPTGKYMSHQTKAEAFTDDQKAAYATQGMRVEEGKATFRKPLVLRHGGQRAGGWKQRLSEVFGAKKKALTRALLKAGYDGIVTVDKNREGNHTSEIISLKGA